ncbi:MAG: trypsin-like serine protease [Oceanospirillaceae bacterium]|nr:trypsin-like serine protease [Oceanospirillaceae bacterium]
MMDFLRQNWIALLLMITTFDCFAVVMRHDVEPERYQLKSAPNYYIDMPHEGSGVLIAAQWILSAAHVIYYDGYEGKDITVAGKVHRIKKVIFHPNYQSPKEDLLSGDAKPLLDFLYQRSDLVLIKLTEPVTHVQPIARFYGSDEVGRLTRSYGSGAIGTGLSGEIIATKTNRELHVFENRIEATSERYFTMRFDRGEAALAIEGIHGSGDSGGPTVTRVDGIDYLVGIQSFRDFQGDLKDFKGGLYGSSSVLCRVSAFNQWIDQTIAEH